MRVIVTAGPTREYIDDVRFISNPSTGKMGYAVAAEARRRGHEVHLLSGPTCLSAPEGAKVSRFESVEELKSLLTASLKEADCLVMAAAVGDYRPRERTSGKRKKTQNLTLELVATPDVLASVGDSRGGRIHVGFAVESENGPENARRKLDSKQLDMIVLNSPESFGADKAVFTLLYSDGRQRPLGRVSKAALAALILDEAEAFLSPSDNG